MSGIAKHSSLFLEGVSYDLQKVLYLTFVIVLEYQHGNETDRKKFLTKHFFPHKIQLSNLL